MTPRHSGRIAAEDIESICRVCCPYDQRKLSGDEQAEPKACVVQAEAFMGREGMNDLKDDEAL